MTDEKKTFEYEQLRALCMLCAAWAVLITVDKSFKNEIEGRILIENKVKELIDFAWKD